jgi:hypothetical protein
MCTSPGSPQPFILLVTLPLEPYYEAENEMVILEYSRLNTNILSDAFSLTTLQPITNYVSKSNIDKDRGLYGSCHEWLPAQALNSNPFIVYQNTHFGMQRALRTLNLISSVAPSLSTRILVIQHYREIVGGR